MEITERFTEEAAAFLRDAIAEAGGNEVFAACRIGGDGLVNEVLVAARGNKSAVPALAPYIERGDVIVHNHPSGALRPSDADVNVAADAGSKGVGSYIVNNAVTAVYVIAEPAMRKAYTMLDEDEISGVLDAGGKLADRIQDYEPRPSQVRLTRDIVRSYNESRILAAEAGTGVGKSFAYLVPSFAWAIKNDERVVISTATINLQKQLIDKDIPVVMSLFRKKTKAVLVKGRGNYLCRTRLREALDEEGLLAGEGSPLRAIADWAATDPSGDRADLSFWPDEALWSRVSSESDSCLGLRCPEREKCFVLRIRHEAASAQVVVANHHILFSDLSARMNGAGYEATAVLPPFRILVIDEAHAIESSATSFFSEELARFSVYKLLSRLSRKRGNKSYGVVQRLSAIHNFPASGLDALPQAMARAREAMDALDGRAVLLFQGKERSYRLIQRTQEIETTLLKPMGELERCLLACSQILKDALDDAPDEISEERAVYEAKLALRRLMDAAGICAKFKEFDEHPETVFFLEKARTSQGDTFVRYTASPLDITGLMEEAVFSKFRSVICASATLSVGESFDFWKARVGLKKTDLPVDTAVYPSPFPFRTNAFLAIDKSAPPPESPAFKPYVNKAVIELLKASRGRALVLFTAYDALRESYEAALPVMEAMGIACLRQGDGERGRLLETFKNDISSVLFATDSFWEGVDAPGETLSLVIIAKLPFKVPTDPVQLARSEACEKRGGNAFMEISLPEAVIRLKQGFGRLIRHSQDRGAVAVLDSRLVTKRYGPLFVESLPPCRILAEDLTTITKAISRFLDDW
jgi:ATP-dependent DNA helicase DinG